MMSHANIPKHLKHLLLPDAVLTATLLDNLIPIEINGKLATKYVHHAGKDDAAFVHNLRTWGEAGTVTIKNRIMHPKSADRAVTCMFIGYSRQHPSGTYRIWNPVTNGVHTTRDVTWLHRTYFPSSKPERDHLPLFQMPTLILHSLNYLSCLMRTRTVMILLIQTQKSPPDLDE
jgi:hypothetical protein